MRHLSPHPDPVSAEKTDEIIYIIAVPFAPSAPKWEKSRRIVAFIDFHRFTQLAG